MHKAVHATTPAKPHPSPQPHPPDEPDEQHPPAPERRPTKPPAPERHPAEPPAPSPTRKTPQEPAEGTGTPAAAVQLVNDLGGAKSLPDALLPFLRALLENGTLTPERHGQLCRELLTARKRGTAGVRR